jgi:CO/xanthine dehydrogenase Mo-binding subunit
VGSLHRWPLLAAIDVPALTVIFVPGGPAPCVASAALGDAAGRATLAAIANAVALALGAPVRQLPIAPEAILDTTLQRAALSAR